MNRLIIAFALALSGCATPTGSTGTVLVVGADGSNLVDKQRDDDMSTGVYRVAVGGGLVAAGALITLDGTANVLLGSTDDVRARGFLQLGAGALTGAVGTLVCAWGDGSLRSGLARVPTRATVDALEEGATKRAPVEKLPPSPPAPTMPDAPPPTAQAPP